MRGEYSPPANGSCGPKELPPRARRILAGAWFWYCMMGTTSACAENTAKRGSFFLAIGNYLRVRGEYYRKTADHQPPGELPPRARRIPTTPPPGAAGGGTTSACAENTFDLLPKALFEWNYLRVRGEYACREPMTCVNSELPPRARRIPEAITLAVIGAGTTSACAENTQMQMGWKTPIWNYLRVRGEYLPSLLAARHTSELPPRARRILTGGFGFLGFEGTTSACAENTSFPRLQQRLCKNYLRVRGEYTWGATESCDQAELPPRARRILPNRLPIQIKNGTTSACAENTFLAGAIAEKPGNYLRVRGEYGKPISRGEVSMELPPRARRIHATNHIKYNHIGTTSACAENTHQQSAPAHPHRNYLRVRGEYEGKFTVTVARLELPPRARRIHLLRRI